MRWGEWLEAILYASASIVLIGFALLKEEPLFWRHAGGWPVWFREFVRITFHPLLVLHGALLAAFTIRALLRGVPRLALLMILFGLWLLATLPLFLSLADNLLEYLEDAQLELDGNRDARRLKFAADSASAFIGGNGLDERIDDQSRVSI
jgi:hypothetical protein